jgi:hypothetical protein
MMTQPKNEKSPDKSGLYIENIAKIVEGTR